jgi:hypothetical protein
LTCFGVKINDMKTTKDMWDAVKADITIKSTLYLLNAKD